ncbi:MAG TPA: DivIVA domain-containing protein [Gaiellaceae bacterium]|jgi:DivIVA domain-containing protein|nr:DivIVA domain-containing protein [Gaiellaceae bacterium]
MAENKASDNRGGEREQAPEPDRAESLTALQAHVPAEIRNAAFPVSVRGYDRRAVDLYVQRVNRVIAELEVTRSPQAAVRHAVERVSEQTKGILQEARESAEKITDAARAEAEQILATAKGEAAELVVNARADADRLDAEAQQLVADARAEAEQLVANARAEAERLVADARAHAEQTIARANAQADERRRRSEEELAALEAEAQARMRELQADTEAVWKERQELLGDIDAMASRLQKAASTAAARFSREEAGDRPKEPPEETEAALDAQPTLVTAPDESQRRRA